MGVCVPKHVVCNWYEPSFVPSSTPCSLPIISTETRSRLVSGGAFFRSVSVGESANNIQVGCVWQVLSGGSPAYRDYNSGTDSLLDVQRVKLTVTNNIITEIYYANQSGSFSGSPTGFQWSVNAITSLRNQLENGSPISQLIRMPDIDVQQPWNSVGSPGDGDHISEFSLTNLSGGVSGPTDQPSLDAIRTGPALTMIYIDSSEKDNTDGSLTTLGEIRYWNGACWKIYNSSAPDCYNPLKYGSPIYGSPGGSPQLFCSLGPEFSCS